MSAPVDLFIGLVTHPRTRFPQSSGPDGLAMSLAREWEQQGHRVTVEVFRDDAWTKNTLNIDSDEIARSLTAELAAESRWRIFQSPRTSKLALKAFMRARLAYRRRKFLPRDVIVDENYPGFRMVRRLVNIEIAHVTLLEHASTMGCDWALILEDDAVADAVSTGSILDTLMQEAAVNKQPLFVNVSRSFGEDRLRVDKHLTDIGGLPNADSQTRVLAATQPFTNTVCAVLYRGSFLPSLVSAIKEIPMSPVIPIDWKLNMALLNLNDADALASQDCWALSPAPITQGSMHTE